MIPGVELTIHRERQSEDERGEPWKSGSLKKDYMKAFACETRSGITSTGAAANDKDLRMLLR